jgi:RNAse (barnase) inhibitor barstar
MNAFSNIPAHSVMPLGELGLDEVRKTAYRVEHTCLVADLSAAKSKAEVLETIGKDMNFGEHFGKNFDALYDCLTDLKPQKSDGDPGFVLVLQNLPNTVRFDDEGRQNLLDVFRDAAEFFFDKEIAFRVFYTVDAKEAAKTTTASEKPTGRK